MTCAQRTLRMIATPWRSARYAHVNNFNIGAPLDAALGGDAYGQLEI